MIYFIRSIKNNIFLTVTTAKNTFGLKFTVTETQKNSFFVVS